MSEQPQREEYEKHEKEEEKREKEDEKQEKDDKDWEEKWRRDPLGAVVWAVVLIWAGLVLLVENMGLLRNLRVGDSRVEAWSIIMIGVGVIFLLEIAVRLAMPTYRRPVGGTLVLAAILVGAGLGNLFGWSVTWPLVLIFVGVALLLRGLIRGL